MSEENQPNTKKLEILKKDAMVKVELPTALYERLNQIIFELIPCKDHSEFLGYIDIINKNEENLDENRIAYHLKTLILTQLQIENAAREQGLTEMVDVPLDTPEDFSTAENQSSPQ